MGVVLFKYVPSTFLHANDPNYFIINNQKEKGLVAEYIVCIQKDPGQIQVSVCMQKDPGQTKKCLRDQIPNMRGLQRGP